MSFWEKAQKVDRRIIYALLLVALVIPLINPIGIPLSYSDTTISFYNEVDALQPGDRVLISVDYSPGGSADVHPQTLAVAKHLVQKGCKLIFVAFWDAGAMFAEQVLQPYLDSGELVYGESVVNLGYIAGAATAIRAFGSDVQGTQPVDFRGNNVSSLPIMQGIKDARDFDLVIEFISGNPGIEEWVQQVQGPLGIKMLCGAVTVSVPKTMGYVDSGQVVGLLQGLRGAAEYEILSGNPASAAAGMDAQSLGHVIIIAFIVLGNIGHFILGGNKNKIKG